MFLLIILITLELRDKRKEANSVKGGCGFRESHIHKVRQTYAIQFIHLFASVLFQVPVMIYNEVARLSKNPRANLKFGARTELLLCDFHPSSVLHAKSPMQFRTPFSNHLLWFVSSKTETTFRNHFAFVYFLLSLPS